MARNVRVRGAYDAVNPGWIGLDAALPRLRAALSQIGSPGIDIVCLGDSIMVTGASQRHQNTSVKEFARLVQARFNPSTVPGGLGFVPTTLGGGAGASGFGGEPVTSSDAPNYSGGDQFAQYELAKGSGAREAGFAGGTTRFVGYKMDGTHANAMALRWFATSFQAVGRTYPGGPVASIDVGIGSWPARGTTTTALSPGGPLNWAMSSPTPAYGARSPMAVLSNRAVHNRIAVRGGPNAGDGLAFVDGLLFCDGDEESGVRVHDLACPGSPLSGWTEESRMASIDAWCTGEPRRNTKVVFLSSLFNDANNLALSAAQFRTQVQTMLQRIIAQPSQPLVVILVPLRPDFSVVSHDSARFESLKAILYEVQPEFAGSSVILDYGSMLQGSAWNGLTSRRGLLSPDKLHLSERGHLSFAHEWLTPFTLASRL